MDDKQSSRGDRAGHFPTGDRSEQLARETQGANAKSDAALDNKKKQEELTDSSDKQLNQMLNQVDIDVDDNSPPQPIKSNSPTFKIPIVNMIPKNKTDGLIKIKIGKRPYVTEHLPSTTTTTHNTITSTSSSNLTTTDDNDKDKD